jgi:adenylate cyclase
MLYPGETAGIVHIRVDRRDNDYRERHLMDNPAADNHEGKTGATTHEGSGPEINICRSMVTVPPPGRLAGLGAEIIRLWETLYIKAQSVPLAYKLSFFITVLIVSCMLLLGMILVQQQSLILQDQINEQGATLVRLMGQSASEPLLADDKQTLGTITESFTGGDSVMATAIISLEGEVVAEAGNLQTDKHGFLKNITLDRATTYTWNLKSGPGRTRQVISFVQPVTFRNITAGYALVTFSQSGLEDSARRSIQAIIGATMLIIALGIAMAFALGRRITNPINKLVDASRAIGKGEYTFKFKERRHDELGLLMDAFNEMAEGMLEKSQVKNALSRYVSPGVARKILSNLNTVELDSKEVEGTVLFADIVGFTQIAEKTQPEALIAMLNQYFSLITCACKINHGTVDKYMGDGVMLIFGAPEPDEEHVFNAMVCALLAQKLIAHESEQRTQQGEFSVKFKIGMNTGSMLAGNMGSKERMEYTVVGDMVNMASRLCGITNGGQIVMSREMYMSDGIRERIVAGEYQSIRLRGISEPVSTYLLEGLIADLQEIVDKQFEEALLIMEKDSENA